MSNYKYTDEFYECVMPMAVFIYSFCEYDITKADVKVFDNPPAVVSLHSDKGFAIVGDNYSLTLRSCQAGGGGLR